MSENIQKLGELFRIERERQGLTIDEMATTLRVSASKIEKLENGDSSEFPSNLYFKLFCKSYAEALGIDYTRTVEAINESLGIVPETRSDMAPKTLSYEKGQQFPELGFTAERKSGKMKLGLGIAVILLILVVTLLKSLEPDTTADALGVSDDPRTNQINRSDSLSFPEMRFVLNITTPTFVVISEGQDTILARRMLAGETYTYSGRQPLQLSVSQVSAVRVSINGWAVDLSDHSTELLSAMIIDPLDLPYFLYQPSPASIDTVVDGVGVQTFERKHAMLEYAATGISEGTNL